MKRLNAKQLNIRKVARFAVILNAAQIATMVAVIIYVAINGAGSVRYVELGMLALGLLIVTLGAVLDIREARNAERIAEQAAMLEDAYSQLETLNGTLRKQRHDFRNHLQVVYALMEMEEYSEALKYVESVYNDIRVTGNALKTAIPAVNALLAAKRSDCAEHGIALEADIRAGWAGMPMPGWEMCRVLGNLIDNARDALVEGNTKNPVIGITIDETPGAYCFSVRNNGPAIPENRLADIFRLGYTTKREGHGSGLSIVKEIMESSGGEIGVVSNDRETVFSGTVPRPPEEKADD